MTKPPFKTMLLGHPIIGLAIYAVGGLILYGCARDPSLWPWGLGALVAMTTTQAAGEQAGAYRNWKRAWDAMDDTPPRPARWPRWIGTILVAIAALLIASHADRTDVRLALGWLALGGVVIAFITMLARWRRHRRARQPNATTVPVALAIRQPLMPVPDMLTSYRSLPPHCHAILRRER